VHLFNGLGHRISKPEFADADVCENPPAVTPPHGVVVTPINVNVVAFGNHSRTNQDRVIIRA
jgi:hypothetical protein